MNRRWTARSGWGASSSSRNENSHRRHSGGSRSDQLRCAIAHQSPRKDACPGM